MERLRREAGGDDDVHAPRVFRQPGVQPIGDAPGAGGVAVAVIGRQHCADDHQEAEIAPAMPAPRSGDVRFALGHVSPASTPCPNDRDRFAKAA